MKGLSGLTGKQERFCVEYLIDGNGTRAAIEAGYSVASASAIAYDNLSKPEIKTFIDRRQREIVRKAEVTAVRVVQELALIAFANMRDYMIVLPDGSRSLDLDAISRDEAAALAEVTYTESGNGDSLRRSTKFKLHSKLQALELLGKTLGMFISSKVEHTGAGGGPIATDSMPHLELARRVAYLLSKTDAQLTGVEQQQPAIEYNPD